MRIYIRLGLSKFRASVEEAGRGRDSAAIPEVACRLDRTAD